MCVVRARQLRVATGRFFKKFHVSSHLASARQPILFFCLLPSVFVLCVQLLSAVLPKPKPIKCSRKAGRPSNSQQLSVISCCSAACSREPPCSEFSELGLWLFMTLAQSDSGSGRAWLVTRGSLGASSSTCGTSPLLLRCPILRSLLQLTTPAGTHVRTAC